MKSLINRKNWINDSLIIKDRSKFVVTRLDDICYIQASKDYLIINTLDKRYTIWKSLKSILDILPKNQFMQVHKSYVVNGDFVESLTMDQIKIRYMDDLIPIGRTFRTAIIEQIELCLLG